MVQQQQPQQQQEQNGVPSEKPFRRRLLNNYAEHKTRLEAELSSYLASLTSSHGDTPVVSDPAFLNTATDTLAEVWKLKSSDSEIAFDGLLCVLEMCLSHNMMCSDLFENFIAALNFHTVFFWKRTVPIIFDSDMQFCNQYRDQLLFSLSFHDLNAGQNRLRELYAAVPGLRNSLLGKQAKKFEEKFRHLVRRRSANSLSTLNHDDRITSFEELDAVPESDEEQPKPPLPTSPVTMQIGTGTPDTASVDGRQSDSGKPASWVTDGSHDQDGLDDDMIAGGLVTANFNKERVINVSNAPPVAIKQDEAGAWSIQQGSGGLVACVDPVMSQDHENVWLANLGPDVDLAPPAPPAPPLDQVEANSDVNSDIQNSILPTTNSLGIPIIKKADTKVQLKVLHDPEAVDEEENTDAHVRQIREQMSLVGVLRDYNKTNYKLTPVQVHKEDYTTYYGGISNGLFWPAFHNLPEYIVSDYDDPLVLRTHWHSYVRVNYQFAINAVRNSRPQDFIWIHDYHLIVTGMIMQSLDPNLEVGFFLHIPFQLPDIFFEKYKQVAFATLRALLRFTKVGFQTHLDRDSFLGLVRTHLYDININYDQKVDIYFVTHDGWTCSLGVFPVSIKNEEYLTITKDPEVIQAAHKLRQQIKGSCTDDGTFFFSVERFDYTKGIGEKLAAFKRYFEKYPDRIGKDVLKQVAVINRRSVDTYRQYQDKCIAAVEDINSTFKCAEKPDWKPIIFQTDGLPRRELVGHYLAMDVGLVCPKKDGMNLVAKEMVICNEHTTLVISTGAGTEQQLTSAGFYTDEEHCYHRVADIYDPDAYATVIYEAATADPKVMLPRVQRMREFLMANDIDRWSAAFLDPAWTHQVIRPTEVRTLDQFYNLMIRTADIRRKIVTCVIKGVPVRNHYTISLRNALKSLQDSCVKSEEGTPSKLELCTLNVNSSQKQSIGISAVGRRSRRRAQNSDSSTMSFDISDEISEFENDLAFIDYVQSDAVDSIEQFLHTLETTHPTSPECFQDEVSELAAMMERADHFHYFFTDRDGTLKSYSCSYPSSVQPAYSGVIQATFARRCAQVCAIITSAPLMHIGILDVHTMPEGCFFYGASGGREWYITGARKFKDNSLDEKQLALLDTLFERLNALLDTQHYRHFRWLGSGLQKHYGAITVARQDVFGSVDEHDSNEWRDEVYALVRRVDPSGDLLHCHETNIGTDIKITVKESLAEHAFTKGDGIELLKNEMELDLTEGNILVCGDTETDVSMLEYCLRHNPANTYTVWVTQDEKLQAKVTGVCSAVGNHNVMFVACPAVLLGAMAAATIRRIKIHYSDEESSEGGD